MTGRVRPRVTAASAPPPAQIRLLLLGRGTRLVQLGQPNGKKQILIVEDDESISLGLRMNLEAEGYDVEVATDGEDGLSRALVGGTDLVILDVMLPKVNGFEVLRRLRAKDATVPIIMLSARGAEMDKVMGLELGAEDYITKPFGLAELLARVKAVLRRDGLSLEGALGEINSRGAGVKIALIDASRRNPYERRFRSFSAGLAPVIAPNGTLVMYSAALSSVISDDDRDHGLFVQELLKELRVPGVMAGKALNQVQAGVIHASHSQQVPWISSSLAEDFAFNPGPPTEQGTNNASQPR